MRIYIAAAYAQKERASELARELRKTGKVITSGWHESRETDEGSLLLHERQGIADTNLRDLRQATTLVLLLSDKIRGGALVEFGLSYSLGHTILVVGSPFDTTLMTNLPGVHWVETRYDLFRKLEQLQQANNSRLNR